MTTRPPYTERIWLEGLDQEAEAFVAAIPEARRDWWDRICIAEESPYGAVAPEGTVYAVFLKGGRYIGQLLTIEALRRMHPAAFAWIERSARMAYEAAERDAAAAPFN